MALILVDPFGQCGRISVVDADHPTVECHPFVPVLISSGRHVSSCNRLIFLMFFYLLRSFGSG